MIRDHMYDSPFGRRPGHAIQPMIVEAIGALNYPELVEVDAYPDFGHRLAIQISVHQDDLAIAEDALDGLYETFRDKAGRLVNHMMMHHSFDRHSYGMSGMVLHPGHKRSFLPTGITLSFGVDTI